MKLISDVRHFVKGPWIPARFLSGGLRSETHQIILGLLMQLLLLPIPALVLGIIVWISVQFVAKQVIKMRARLWVPQRNDLVAAVEEHHEQTVRIFQLHLLTESGENTDTATAPTRTRRRPRTQKKTKRDSSHGDLAPLFAVTDNKPVECPICLEQLPREDTCVLHAIHTICKLCARQMIRSKLDNRGVDPHGAAQCNLLTTKGNLCKARLQLLDLQSAEMPKESISQLVLMRLTTSLPCFLANHKRRFTELVCLLDFLCPFCHTSHRGTQTSAIVKCRKCRSHFCRWCVRPTHSHAPWCEPVYRNELESIKMLLDVAKDRMWQACPACSQLIESTGGCYHMTHRGCPKAHLIPKYPDAFFGVHFCYQCSAILDPRSITREYAVSGHEKVHFLNGTASPCVRSRKLSISAHAAVEGIAAHAAVEGIADPPHNVSMQRSRSSIAFYLSAVIALAIMTCFFGLELYESIFTSARAAIYYMWQIIVILYIE